VALAAGLHNYFLQRCRLWERLALIAGAFVLIKPGLLTDAIGLGLLAVVLTAQRMLPAGPRQAAATPPAE
jgi:TRAP-type uncharacterized transport system fused permease subunit